MRWIFNHGYLYLSKISSHAEHFYVQALFIVNAYAGLIPNPHQFWERLTSQTSF